MTRKDLKNSTFLAEVVYESALRTSAVHLRSGSTIITDAPPDNRGKGEAFSPTDLTAVSLACCMLTVLGIKAVDQSFSIDGAKASVVKVMADNPRRIATIQIIINFP